MNAPTAIKLCVNCAHFYGGRRGGYCQRPLAAKPLDPVMGRGGMILLDREAVAERKRETWISRFFEDRCGLDAKYFKPKDGVGTNKPIEP